MENKLHIEPFSVGNVTFGDGRLTVIAGPCVIESPEHALMMARECSSRARAVGLDYVYKASFDKANRSSIKSFRGLGIEAGEGHRDASFRPPKGAGSSRARSAPPPRRRRARGPDPSTRRYAARTRTHRAWPR